MTKLRDIWDGILYARRVLHLDWIIIQDNSATIIAWIREATRLTPSHPIIHDIALLLNGCMMITVRHVYREANYVADWMAFYVARHSDEVLWTCLDGAPLFLRDIILFDSLDCIHSRIVV